ncbi:MAG: tetratricopeptide repeat protein [Calothrix sp. SM1_5_4]|nr:tetratricopeptide repeat protein [Calothrix sp. SM1_5_4]
MMFEGDQFFREGDYHAAQAHYKAAFEEDQKNAQAALKAAQCLWRLSFSTEAMDWLGRAIKADPKLIEAYVTMADYQAQRYNFLVAVRILEQARRVNPKSSEVYRGFALVELRRGNAKGAATYGKKALEIYDNDVETLITLAQASLAMRDPKMAYNYAKKATEIDVNHRKAQITLAESVAGIQGIDAGVDYFLRLVNNYPWLTSTVSPSANYFWPTSAISRPKRFSGR